MKTWLINVLDNTIEINDPQEGDNNATVLTVDFTGCGVDAIPKWVDFVMADGTMLPASLGNGIICTYNISNLITKDGNLHLQAYATNGTDLTYKGKVFRVPIKRSLNVSGNTSEYTIGVVEALQNSISEALTQVETIWDAYEAGTLGGASAYQVAVNNGFVGTEAEWLLSLKGADGADGTNGTNGTNGLDGADGLSAYQVAVQNGFVGTEAQWLLSLVGATGADGQDGSNFTILGQYATLGALQTAHPTGSAGDAWAVGTSESSDLYIWDTVTNSWKDIGQVGINMTADSVTVEDLDENYTGLTVEEVLSELPTKFMEVDGGNSSVISLTFNNGTILTIDTNRQIANYSFPDGTTANLPSELWYAEGKATEAINEGDNCMFAGSQGDFYLIKKAVASELALEPHLYAGVATKSSAINGWVKVTKWGLVNNINTNGFAYGTKLYFNPATLGFTDVLPALPNARIYVGMVVKQGISNGILLVEPHDMSLYTNAEIDTLLSGKANSSHAHSIGDITGLESELGGKATYTVYTATIPSSSWTGSSAPFSKVVAVSGILALDEPIIDLVLSGTYATDVTMRENWSKIYRIVTTDGNITCYADSVPSADINIQLVVVR